MNSPDQSKSYILATLKLFLSKDLIITYILLLLYYTISILIDRIPLNNNELARVSTILSLITFIVFMISWFFFRRSLKFRDQVFIFGRSGAGKTTFLLGLWRITRSEHFRGIKKDPGNPDLNINPVDIPNYVRWNIETEDYLEKKHGSILRGESQQGTQDITIFEFEIGGLKILTADYPGEFSNIFGDKAQYNMLMQQIKSKYDPDTVKKILKTLKRQDNQANVLFLIDGEYIDPKTGKVKPSQVDELDIDIKSLAVAIFAQDERARYEDIDLDDWRMKRLKMKLCVVITKADLWKDGYIRYHNSLDEILNERGFEKLKEIIDIFDQYKIIASSSYGDQVYQNNFGDYLYHEKSQPWGIVQPFHFFEYGDYSNELIYNTFGLPPNKTKFLQRLLIFIIFLLLFIPPFKEVIHWVSEALKTF